MPLFIKMLSQDQDGTEGQAGTALSTLKSGAALSASNAGAEAGSKNFWWTVEFSIEVLDFNQEIFNKEVEEERLFTVASLTGSIGSELFDNNDDKITLKASYTSSQSLDDLLKNINKILELDDFKNIKITRCYRTNNQAWSTQHLDAFPPLNVGRNLVVMAPWHKSNYVKNSDNQDKKQKMRTQARPAVRTSIYIYPASAFGTGYHESTRIALELLESTVKQGDTIIDVGTGTGILFIAALKIGASHATARDIDPVTLDEVRRNMNLNGLNPDLCDLAEGNLLDGVEGKFNILTANILLAPNMAMLPDVKRVLKPKGYAVFSGMTHMERGAFLSVLSSSGLELDKELKCGDWWGCRAKLKSA